MPGWRRRDNVADESVPSRRRSPPIAIETDESRTAPHRTALRWFMLPRQAWTPSVHRGWTHICTPLQYTREMQTMFSMIIETKNLQHESCVKQYGEATRQRKFLTSAHLRRIWQNLVKLVSNKIEAYTKRNSKRMVRMDSPCRGAFFSYGTHISTIHGYENMKGLWGSCLEEGERKLNEGGGKQVYVQALTTFGSREPETRMALEIRSIWEYPQRLGGECFNVRAGHDLDVP
jgi:hypothetical protein